MSKTTAREQRFATELFERAIGHYMASNYEIALEILATVRKIQPRMRNLHLYMGYAYRAIGNYKLAADQLFEAHLEGPENLEICLALGDIFYELSNFAVAERWYQKAIQINEEDPRPWHSLGMAYLTQGFPELATQQFDQAIELDNSFWCSYCCLGEIYREKKEHEKAVRVFEKALKNNRENVRIMERLEQLYELLGRFRRRDAMLKRRMKALIRTCKPYLM